MTEPTVVTTADLRAHLAKYLREVAAGSTFYITSNGYQVAALLPVEDARQVKGRH